MAAGLSLQTRRALLEHMAPAYRKAPPAKKRVLLEEFTRTTGYHRVYAQWLERYHRTYGQECLQVYQPSTLQQVREVTEAFLQHYHYEVLIRDEPVAIGHLVWLFQPCPPCPPFQSESILMPG